MGLILRVDSTLSWPKNLPASLKYSFLCRLISCSAEGVASLTQAPLPFIPFVFIHTISLKKRAYFKVIQYSYEFHMIYMYTIWICVFCVYLIATLQASFTVNYYILITNISLIALMIYIILNA